MCASLLGGEPCELDSKPQNMLDSRLDIAGLICLYCSRTLEQSAQPCSEHDLQHLEGCTTRPPALESLLVESGKVHVMAYYTRRSFECARSHSHAFASLT